jgi:uncharacterized protein YjbJ (UPF0337 family)
LEKRFKLKRLQTNDKWQHVKAQFQMSWSALSDEDLQSTNGTRQMLVLKIQEKYGLTKEQAENALKNWEIQHRSFL